MDISDDIKNAYFDGYDNGYNAGFEAGQREVLLENTQLSREDATSDTISRQGLIDFLAEIYAMKGYGWEEVHFSMNDMEMNIIMQPSAEPERKTGRWIPQEDEDGEHYGDKCSECGEWYVMPFGKTNYCPVCGAKLEG